MLKGIKCTFKTHTHTHTTRKKWACLPRQKSKGPENCNGSSADMSSNLNRMCKFLRTQWRWTEPDARYCGNCWLLWLSRRLTAWNWKECKHFMSTCPCRSLADSLGSIRLDLSSKTSKNSPYIGWFCHLKHCADIERLHLQIATEVSKETIKPGNKSEMHWTRGFSEWLGSGLDEHFEEDEAPQITL